MWGNTPCFIANPHLDEDTDLCSECTKRADLLFLTDSWNPQYTYKLYTQLAALVRRHNSRLRLGLMTHSRDDPDTQQAFNVTMATAGAFTTRLSTFYNQSFCCGSVVGLILQAMKMFAKRTARRRADHVIVYVTHDVTLTGGDTLEDIATTSETALSTNIDKLVHACFVLSHVDLELTPALLF